ncbi:ATP-binding cassette domain-containing protein [Phocaeicola plebeius]|uniref:ATP-binding cassette domain-containing protein n=1 Tax=Phocaeicola plebeius TaxID=310297 RepID=A0A415J129_9BACT|nr:ABC transporter ATP-binding protein [Phocaeicola plebeius]RHK93661.1 ATP-binding cassette domain-containing protein [Phocaeicola plebeius]RHL13575.1 ATP-binding cassette domain-containing protein [Phocaeicola plebeius]
MNDSFLETRQVIKRYANHTALDGVSITVPEGQVFGLLGPNGAGKTTLIRIINRITAPDAGEVWFDGRLSRPEDIYSIGYLPEERGLYKKMKVGEQAIYLAQLKGLSRQEAKKRLTDWFERFEIMPWWNKKLEELSKGMQQKVQFVITVLHRPRLLIFDEPFSGFDPVNAELLKREILKLKDKGHTIIFSTHNMASVEEICDHIALINHSKVVLQGAVTDIRSRYKSNQYELTMQSSKPLQNSDAFEIVSSEVQDEQTVNYKLRKLTSISNSELLSLVGAQGEICKFTECIPSMNDIFIRTVEEKI